MPAEATADSSLSVSELQLRVEELAGQLRSKCEEYEEALQREAAVSEILQVINAPGGDLAPVFDAVLEKAMRLCGASFGILRTYDGSLYHGAASRGVPAAYAEFLAHNPQRAQAGTIGARILAGEPFVHVIDVADDKIYPSGDPHRRALVELGGARTSLVVPLTKERAVLGAIQLYRQHVQAFSEKQITLLQDFAAQAVIAMENARLLGELRQRTDDLQESLEHQTASSDVLKVISRSGAELGASLGTLVQTAARLCDAQMAFIHRREGGVYRPAAVLGFPSEFTAYLKTHPLVPGRGSIAGRVAMEGRAIHIPDVAADPEYELSQAIVMANQRTALGVPLLRENEPVGVIVLARQRVQPFTEREIALVSTFADQAVIAIENARLLTEQREALEQQTATAEVLQVINSSPGDLTPVFEAMLEKALTLCNASFGQLLTFDGDRFRAVAWRAYKPESDGTKPTPGMALYHLVQGEQVVHIADITADDVYRSGNAVRRRLADEYGARTAIWVALRKRAVLLGALVIYRTEVRPFTDKQIAVLEGFADQAVIAIENTRLLTEQREALEQQTATAEVLQVINSSPGDLAPVFEAMLEKATGLCEAAFGILWTYDGEGYHAAAFRNVPQAYAEYLREPPPATPETPLGRIKAGEPFAQIPDMAADRIFELSPLIRQAVELGGFRTVLGVALRKEGTLLGAITIYRQEVRLFSDKQVTLLQNFAAQAVIAMENARLFEELRDRQAELRVTIDNIGGGVGMFDADLRLTAWNRNFQQIMDLSDQDLAARPTYGEYLRLLADRGEYGTENVEAVLSGYLEDTERELRLERTRPDGRVIEARRNAVPGGGFVLIYSDITERKRSEEQIRAARDVAETALKELKTAQASLIHAEKMASLGQLTAGIAHEIKNPLNFVNNFAGLSVELLNELTTAVREAAVEPSKERRHEIDETIELLTTNLEKIASHGRRADGIVKSMLAHSRGGSSERRSVDINAIVEEALNLAYHGARAQDQSFNVTLERDLQAEIASIEIVPQDVTRVFLNLIGNGFYAVTKRRRQEGEAFHPILKVTTRDSADAVEIAIRDNGIGIPPQHRQRLFQPFFTTKPTGEGTGLGLSISYDVVTQQHGGTITVDSKPGRFTEFRIRLPRRGQAAAAAGRPT